MRRLGTIGNGLLAAAGLFLGIGSTRAAGAASQGFAPRPEGWLVSFHSSQDVRRSVIEYDDQVIEQATLKRQFLQVAYRPAEAVLIQARLGEMSWDPHSRQGGIYDYGPAWGFGVRTRIWSWPEAQTALGMSFQYNRGRPADRYRPWRRNWFSGIIEEWQVSADAQRDWGPVALFAGLRYSQIDLAYIHDSIFTLDRKGGFEAVYPVGLYAGVEWTITPAWCMAVEIRGHDFPATWWDDLAVGVPSGMGGSFSAGYRF